MLQTFKLATDKLLQTFKLATLRSLPREEERQRTRCCAASPRFSSRSESVLHGYFENNFLGFFITTSKRNSELVVYEQTDLVEFFTIHYATRNCLVDTAENGPFKVAPANSRVNADGISS